MIKSFSGSYSYRTPACDEANIGPSALEESLEDKVLFGGEATDREHFASVTGAMAAGIREGAKAVRILKSW